jgi:hemolysin activation/secretion protein
MNVAMARWAGVLALGCCTLAEAAAQEAPAADARRIDILNYRIEGNTALPRVKVERAVMPFLGPQRPSTDVEAARAALEKAYRDAGFETVTVRIPEQEVRSGVIQLNVDELTIGQVRVTDARHYSPEDIKKKLPSLAEGKVPNYRDISAEMAELNKSGERLVSPALRAGDTPDTVNVDLRVEDKLPLHGSLELNDRSSSRTERLRAAASLRYGNLFQLGHTLAVQGQLTPTDPGQAWSVSGSYTAPLSSSLSLLVYGMHSNNDVFAANGINVQGTGDIVGARASYSFTTGSVDALTVHQINAGIDYKRFREMLILDTVGTTPIDYFPISVQYSRAQRRPSYDLDIALAVSAGLRGLDATETEFGVKRFMASANWVTFRTDIGFVWRVGGDWRLRTNLSGQIASGALVSNEQFTAGGLDSVRGYYESQELGDDGVSGQFQIDLPSLLNGKRGINELRFFTFVDGAWLNLRYPLAGQTDRTWLASAGAGFNLRAFNLINASALLAAPLRDRDSTAIDIGDSLRAQFRLWTEF